jgi:hypothetical protein
MLRADPGANQVSNIFKNGQPEQVVPYTLFFPFFETSLCGVVLGAQMVLSSAGLDDRKPSVSGIFMSGSLV